MHNDIWQVAAMPLFSFAKKKGARRGAKKEKLLTLAVLTQYHE